MSVEDKPLLDTVLSAGWKDVRRLGDQVVKDARSELETLMLSAPEKLTGKVAIGKAARAAAVEDFLELVEKEAKR